VEAAHQPEQHEYGDVQRHDPGHRVQERDRGPLAEAGRDITGLGGVVVLALVTAVVVGYLLIEGKRRAATFVILATAGGLLLSSLLKDHFNRERPGDVSQLSYVYTSSFPSGHAMMSAAVYLTLGSLLMRLEPRRRLKLYYLLVAMLLVDIAARLVIRNSPGWPSLLTGRMSLLILLATLNGPPCEEAK
jgi:undecaprenyl-diphosphatase